MKAGRVAQYTVPRFFKDKEGERERDYWDLLGY